MEDILSILVVILFAVISVNRKNKKKKAKAPDSKGAVSFSAPQDKGFGEMKEFIKDVGKTVLEMEDDDDEYTSPAKMKPARMKAKSRNAVSAKHEHRTEPAAPLGEGTGAAPVSNQGRSLFEEKGCLSGSIEHDSHEGDSKYPYSALEGAGQTNDSPWAEDIAGELQSLNVHRLRRAIVISEILDKPKALRRR
ncbi:MAG: hypothetical protein IKM02_06290 [Clostridia bacterium]|nr:hypothetical protein [Clostridia bacterium]